ncbi:MAG: Maf family protein [Gallionella sp.]|nr:Maf family protein [Gallionella sp.]
MSTAQNRIYLASQSPRRRELLKQIGVNFDLLLLRNDTLRGLDVDETPHKDELPEDYVRRVCGEKAATGYAMLRYRHLPAAPVLAADTAVILDGKILGKPESPAHATEMLLALSGREHQVLTAVAMALGEHVEMAVSTSMVRFASLDEDRIRRYLFSNEYKDKAGGYAIQGLAGAFVENISGSYSGVVGLPLCETVALLRKFNVPTP